jgi:diguanylate cyclase (GGDEF)-like protein
MNFLALLDYFDIQTLALLVTISFFVQTLILVTFFLLANEYRGIGEVACGNVVYGCSFGAILLRGHMPDLILVSIAVGFSLAGAFLLLYGLAKFCGLKYNIWPYALFTLLIWLTSLYLGLVAQQINARMVVVSLGLACLLGSAAFRLFRSPTPSFKIGAWLTGLPLLIYAIFLLIRMLAVLRAPARLTLLDQNWVQVLFFLLVFICSGLWSGGFTLMITQRLRHDLHEQARFDVLTRRPNRLSMQERLETALTLTRRTGNPFSILIIDVDHFKLVNDLYGHDAGDSVLRQVAERLGQSLRPQDNLGRWGGEEFLAILPETDANAALNIAERLRLTCASQPCHFGEAAINVTISAGVAVWVPLESDIQTILRNADRALYAAKDGGRNQVILAG